MTRFGNPLAPSQVPNPHAQNGHVPNAHIPNTHIPNTQGRAAGGQPAYAPQPGYGYDQSQAQPQDGYDPMAWAGAQGAPRTGRPAAPAQNYADHGYAHEPPSQHRDAYAALRPDGYGYAQPASQASTQDPFGLAGYTAPQTTQASVFGQRAAPAQPAAAPAPSYDGYAGDPFGGSFGAAGATPGYGQPAHNGAPSFGASQGYGAQPSQPAHGNDGFGSGLSASGYGPNAGAADQWNGHGYALDGHGHSGYGEAQHDPHQGHWGGAQGYDPTGHIEPSFGGAPAYGQHDLHQQHQHQVSFDQSYAEDDAQYQDAPAPRRSFKKIAAVMTCTVLVGVGVTMAYSALLGPGSDEPTPVVKGLASPAKVKPSDPGGKQFDHTDSKIMGRLGEGGAPSADPAGVKKVPIVTVGRDGSIQAPGSEETRAVVAVPGLTVIDGLGAPSGLNPTRPATPAAAAQPAPVEMVNAVEKKKAEAAKAPVVAPTKAAASERVPAIPAKSTTVLNTPAPPKAEPKAEPKKQRVAAVTDDAAPVGPKPTGAGYVAVLASVPASGSSRMDALKQFADMQQKYGMILQNKTPDIQEANLGAKGTYHRLLVGPPGSRDSATSVCTQLKAEGYSGCWVTAY